MRVWTRVQPRSRVVHLSCIMGPKGSRGVAARRTPSNSKGKAFFLQSASIREQAEAQRS